MKTPALCVLACFALVPPVLAQTPTPRLPLPDKWTLRNYEGKLVDYPQPADKDATCAYDEIFFGG